MNDKNVPLSGKYIFKIALLIFNVLLASSIILGIVLIIMYRMKFLVIGGKLGIFGLIVAMFVTSIILGTLIGLIFGYRAMKPFRDLTNASKQIAKGDFKVKIEEIPVDDDLTEINQLIKNFNTMASKLAEIETLRSDFISNVSHEFKTPLSTIQGYVVLLEDDKISKEERKRYIDIIFEATTKLTNLTSNILKISKLENQDIEISKKEYNISEQIRETIILLQSSWEQKNINFDLSLPDLSIISDEELLQQVWMNIISNAIKFSSNNSMIRIYLRHDNDNVSVYITDYGIGMDEETKNHMFDKFYQGDKSHSKSGNGLGLALTHKIVSICKGHIDVESELEKGTTIVVHLPIVI